MFESKFKNEHVELFIDAILSLNDREEAYRFFEDVCTAQEFLSLAQRLSVAKLLLEKTTYQEIAAITGASSATISRVNRSLKYGADGYMRVLQRLKYIHEDGDEV